MRKQRVDELDNVILHNLMDIADVLATNCPASVLEWNRLVTENYERRRQAEIDEINARNNPKPKRYPKHVKGVTLKRGRIS